MPSLEKGGTKVAAAGTGCIFRTEQTDIRGMQEQVRKSSQNMLGWTKSLLEIDLSSSRMKKGKRWARDL